jgi:allophanate hydrolase
MDRMAYRLAHYALGKDTGAAIEVSMGGLSLTCQQGQVAACVTGGGFTVLLDGKEIPSWSAFVLTQGSKLQIRAGKWGSWCYLAFAGAMDVPTWLGSASTHTASDLCGAPLAIGDTVHVTDADPANAVKGQVLEPEKLKPPREIRVVLGPQDRFFADKSIQDLQTEKFTLTADYNRQGVRLAGPKLEIIQALDMPSEPVARGALQVAGHGDPVCLLADHQTTGGYPKIAMVISADQDKLAQMRTGDQLRFKVVDVETATLAAKSAKDFETELRDEIDVNRQTLDQKLWNSNLVSGVVQGAN